MRLRTEEKSHLLFTLKPNSSAKSAMLQNIIKYLKGVYKKRATDIVAAVATIIPALPPASSRWQHWLCASVVMINKEMLLFVSKSPESSFKTNIFKNRFLNF